MFRAALGVAIGVSLMGAAAQRALAGPVIFGSNAYEFVAVSDPFTGTNNAWMTDSTAAGASVFNGVHGHLAVITSQAENDFLFGLVSGRYAGSAGAWLGGKAPEGWLVGPEAGKGFGYTNWGGIEPNNAGYLWMNIGDNFVGVDPGYWFDDSYVQGVPDAIYDPVVGYFVEYDVPEPSSLWLLFAGGLIPAWRRRIRIGRVAVK
jgi:hypothetical protein